ncbi:MAG TPA: hypothetical protein VFV67_15925 [Actinophytocola sp.]|uniref:hypothetical protein n=1 Tax=Actinophytocola sp. TaxID=1872138 RepID=UPI002DBC3FAF|nr:hypothetical protein [Actinophytocola sp.]HEU5472141.1 hypothetical protein [Actinophytocola sp.]
MYLEEQSAGGAMAPGSGWQVDADQVRAFAAAVAQVRANLDAVSTEVTDMGDPSLAPMLGTSPVGQELSEKFTDRLGGTGGLRGQLEVALKNMEEFVASAERTVAAYEQTDADGAGNYRYS